jgi:hypothetical protein
MADSRVATYKRLLRETAKQLGEKTDTEVVRHVATLRMARENLQVQLLRGERIDPADLIKLDAALKQYLPQGKPLEVTINIVDRKPGQSSPEPPDPPPTPPTSPPPSDKPSSSEPSNVVPLPLRSAAEDREAILQATRPPLQTSQPWRSYVGPVGDPYGGSNPFSAPGPIPNFSAPYRGR